MFFKFLPNSVQGRHVFDLFIKSRLMKGHRIRCPNSVMPHAAGCVECKTSVTNSLRLLGIASLLSNSTQPFCTLTLLHLAWICLQSFLHRCSSPVRMQSRTSRSTVSRLVMAAMSWVLKMSSGGGG